MRTQLSQYSNSCAAADTIITIFVSNCEITPKGNVAANYVRTEITCFLLIKDGLVSDKACYPYGSVAERSKALVLGTSPKGRGFESHRCQKFYGHAFNHKIFLINYYIKLRAC